MVKLSEETAAVPVDEASIHGDVLEYIFTYVPLVHLIPVIYVSKAWKRAVSTSLRHFNKIKPWLFLHSQRTIPPYTVSSHAYDPRSDVWVQIHHRPITSPISALRSAHSSSLLYTLSPSKLSFSVDPLHLTWHHVAAPLVWRIDPIVASFGGLIVVAGGGCEFEDDPLAVEMYDLSTRTWHTCASMPAMFKDSASPTWLSIAVNGDKMLVTEKSTGMAYMFEPHTKSWYGPYDLRPDGKVRTAAIGFAEGRLILIGLIGDDHGDFRGVKLWKLSGDLFEVRRELGEMPEQLVERLRGDKDDVFSVSLSSAIVNVIGDLVFISNSLAPEEVFICEIGSGEGGACSWSSVRSPVVHGDHRLTERLVFTCGEVGLGDLHWAKAAEGVQFSVIS